MKSKNLRLISLICTLIFTIVAIGATVSFSKFYGDYEKDAENVKIADAVASIKVDSISRTDSQNTKLSIEFDKNAKTVMLYDVEPEDKIEYYFTVSGINGKRVNEVSLNVVLSVTVRLETIVIGKDENQNDYFGGWTEYNDENSDGIKYGASLEIYSGSENESATAIRPSKDQNDKVEYTGDKLAIITSENSIVNKIGFVMAADDNKKEYPFHLFFTLPKQNTEKENYAGARVYFDIQAVAEQR